MFKNSTLFASCLRLKKLKFNCFKWYEWKVKKNFINEKILWPVLYLAFDKDFFINKLNFRTRDREEWSWIFRMIPSSGLETQSIVYTVHCLLHCGNCDMFSVSVHCAVYILHYAVCSMQWVLFSV